MKSAEEIGQAILERLAAQAAANRAAGDVLRGAVRAVMNELPPERHTAKWVIRGLARLAPGRPLPSIRRVQEIMRPLRAGTNVASSASR